MGKCNDAMCNYLSRPTVFADFWNGGIFGEREELRAKYKHMISNCHMNLITLQDIDETKLTTGLRELIGVMKRSGNKEALYAYCKENEERFFRLDEETIDTIQVMLNQENILKYKEKKGGIDMCKAFDDMRTEGKIEGQASAVVVLLERLGMLSETLRNTIMTQADENTLLRWLLIAAQVRSVAEFEEKIGE